MDATTPARFRQAVYQSCTRSDDALFEIGDAVLTHPGARSFVERSEAPSCQRRWCSFDAAPQDGRVDRAAAIGGG